MNKFDRFFLFLFSLLIGAVSAFLLLLILGYITNFDLSLWLSQVQEADWAFISMVILCVIVLLLSIRYIVFSMRNSSKRPLSYDQRTDFGDVSISAETISNLALKSASRTKGAQDFKVRVQMHAEGLEIMVRVFVDGERAITDITEEVQQSVKNTIEDLTGIPVHSVSVFVANLIHTPTLRSSRVE